MKAAWSKFWALRWRVKGPILVVTALIVLGIIGAASGGSDEPTQAEPEATDVPAGPSATKAPTNTVTAAPPTATPTPPGYSFGAGVKRAGADFVPATYRTREDPPQTCYWERLSGFGGTFAEIIANDNTDGPAVVTLAASDVGFNSTRCGTWTQDLSPITSSPTAPFKAGTYIVGVDIAPGTWQSDSATGCYWQRMSGFGGTGISDIIANANPTGPAVVTIAATDAGFSSDRCGTWTKIG